MTRATSTTRGDRRARGERLGFRVDAGTKALVEQAAQLQRRNVTEFCLGALADAARETIARHETLDLSANDRAAFFDALIQAPEPNPRLQRAFDAERRVVEP